MNAYGFGSGDPVNYSDPFGLCPVTAIDKTPCDNPSTLAAYAHYIGGSGTPLTRDFATIDTKKVKPSQFSAVQAALKGAKPGTTQIDGKMPFDTHDKVDGNITLRLQGTLTTSCVSESCAYTFKGSLSA